VRAEFIPCFIFHDATARCGPLMSNVTVVAASAVRIRLYSKREKVVAAECRHDMRPPTLLSELSVIIIANLL